MTDQAAAPKSVWTRDLELGIPLIDGQHRKLVERLDEWKYPGLEDHKKIHQTFRANVTKADRAVKTRLAGGQSVNLIRSMVIRDQEYAAYVRDKGLLKGAKS